MLMEQNFTMELAVPSNFEARVNAVKLAARARVLGRYKLKDLFREHKIAPPGPGAWNKTKAIGKHVAEFGREAIFGSPITVGKQLASRYKRTGSAARTAAGHIKDFYLSPGSPGWVKALSMGLPALELGDVALRGDATTRRGDIAHALSGVVAAPFTARLGLAGIPIQNVLQGAAQHFGSKFDPPAPPGPTSEHVEKDIPEQLVRAWHTNTQTAPGANAPSP